MCSFTHSLQIAVKYRTELYTGRIVDSRQYTGSLITFQRGDEGVIHWRQRRGRQIDGISSLRAAWSYQSDAAESLTLTTLHGDSQGLM